MIHSMPWHAKSWMVFAHRHGIDSEVEHLARPHVIAAVRDDELAHSNFLETLDAFTA